MGNIVANPQGFQPRGKRGEGEREVGGRRGGETGGEGQRKRRWRRWGKRVGGLFAGRSTNSSSRLNRERNQLRLTWVPLDIGLFRFRRHVPDRFCRFRVVSAVSDRYDARADEFGN